jgi:tRNA-specific 2-thiouridylase
LVFNFSDDFDKHVVSPYVQAHVDGITPNPCIECNRHLKFDRLSERARLLGFDAVATGHHARIERDDEGTLRLARGADDAKDQSYVVHMLDQAELAYTMFPVGHLTKTQVRERAVELGLRTATKPDSQDVCFISKTGGRETFLGNRIPFRKAEVVNEDGTPAGKVEALELVTIGQRKGLGIPGGGPKQYVVEVDTPNARVVIGEESSLYRKSLVVNNIVWSDAADINRLRSQNDVLVQSSAHGAAIPATVEILGNYEIRVLWAQPQRAIAPGQSVVLYNTTNSYVLAGGIACPESEKVSSLQQ